MLTRRHAGETKQGCRTILTRFSMRVKAFSYVIYLPLRSRVLLPVPAPSPPNKRSMYSSRFHPRHVKPPIAEHPAPLSLRYHVVHNRTHVTAKRRLHPAEHRAPVVAPSRRVQHVVVANVNDPLVKLVENQPGVIALAARYFGRQRGQMGRALASLSWRYALSS